LIFSFGQVTLISLPFKQLAPLSCVFQTLIFANLSLLYLCFSMEKMERYSAFSTEEVM
jgi:hypothetical protein